MITLSKPIQIPKVWKDLVKIVDIEECPKDQYPSNGQELGDTTSLEHSFNPNPYPDDHRYAEVIDGDSRVSYVLKSGNRDYWISREIHQKEAGAPDFSDAELIHEVTDSCADLDKSSDEIETSIGKITVPLEFVESIALVRESSAALKR